MRQITVASNQDRVITNIEHARHSLAAAAVRYHNASKTLRQAPPHADALVDSFPTSLLPLASGNVPRLAAVYREFGMLARLQTRLQEL